MNRVHAVVALFALSGLLVVGGVVAFIVGLEVGLTIAVLGGLLALLSTIPAAILFAVADT